MKLRSSPKRPGFHRGVIPAETLDRVLPLASRIGITRLSDITGLDRTGIPVWSSVLPKSRDVLSVYNGKGATHTAAKVGAIMEAFERNAGFLVHRPVVRGSYGALSKERATLDPRCMALALRPDYTPDLELAWTVANHLMTGEEILVPADLVWMGLDPSMRTYRWASTTGLSAGNTYEEAISQALCEIIERDAWTIAEVLSHYLPRSRWAAGEAMASRPPWNGEGPQPFHDDYDRFPEIDPDSLNGALGGQLRSVYDRYVAADLVPRLRDITGDTGIPTVIAMVTGDALSGWAQAHAGVGTHPDPAIAAMRALTEAAQGRTVDIQGQREDMVPAGQAVPAHMMHAKRPTTIEPRYWLIGRSRVVKPMDQVPRPPQNNDTLDDIRLMVDRLRAVGLETVLEIDMTHPETEVPATRVIVPGAESWAVDHGNIGKRAARHWNANRKL
jgi:ribosomal protein S12 methylthiotransferase accessory factor